MQAVTFKDPVTSEQFTSSNYEVRQNGSGNILRATAPSGATAVRMQTSVMKGDVYDDMAPTTPQYDSDISQQELANMAEDYQENMNIETNPTGRITRGIGKLTAKVGGFGPGSWQALRLPAVGFGQRKGLVSGVASLFKSLGIDRGTFRSGPYANMITARMWTDYLNNMDMQDVGAELSAEVSAEEKLSVFAFCKEWENDPGHVAFTQRLYNTPDTNSVDEIAKGNIVYDLMTGGILPGPGPIKDPRAVKHDKMFRLAIDIINSMRVEEYNFYTLNLVHRNEGTRLYDEFMANYVPLEPDEVEVVHEVMRGTENHGHSYAMRTVDEKGDPMGAYDLMVRLGNAYNSGDTRLCRSILDTLFAYPYNFVPQVGYKGLFDATSSRFIGQEPLHLWINNGWRWILPNENVTQVKDGGKQFQTNTGDQLIEVLSYTYPRPIGVFTKLDGGKNKFSFMPWSQFEATGQAAASMVPKSQGHFDERIRDAESRDRSKDKSQSHGGGKNKKGKGGRGGRRNPSSKKNPGHGGGMDERAAGMLRNTKYARLVNMNQMRTALSQLTRETPYLMFGSNGFWVANDSMLRDYGDGVTDVASFARGHGDQGEYVVYNLNTNKWFPFGEPAIQLIERNPAPGRKGKKDGTLSLGRGKQYHIEILPKTQLKVKTKGAPGVDKKTGKSRPKGKSNVKSQGETRAERKAGITEAFNSYMHVGDDKKTGKSVPYVIKVPSSKFRAVNLEVGGKTIRTLMPMTKTSKAQQNAWAKFLTVYGYPKLANTKGDPVRFKIHKPTRGTFYRQLAKDRKKVGA